MRPKKVTVTETVTAELVTPARAHRGQYHRGGAVTDAIAVTNVLVGGAAAALALGSGTLSAFASAAHAAHGATAAQHSGTTLLEASTVTAVARLLQPPEAQRQVRRAMPRDLLRDPPRDPGARGAPCCRPGSRCARCRTASAR